MKTFEQALSDYDDLSRLAILAEEKYRLAHVHASAKSESKNADGRKADADVATSELRVRRDETALAARVAEHRVIYLRDRRGELAS